MGLFTKTPQYNSTTINMASEFRSRHGIIMTTLGMKNFHFLKDATEEEVKVRLVEINSFLKRLELEYTSFDQTKDNRNAISALITVTRDVRNVYESYLKYYHDEDVYDELSILCRNVNTCAVGYDEYVYVSIRNLWEILDRK